VRSSRQLEHTSEFGCVLSGAGPCVGLAGEATLVHCTAVRSMKRGTFGGGRRGGGTSTLAVSNTHPQQFGDILITLTNALIKSRRLSVADNKIHHWT
jgi:hypothetical protein